MAEGKNRKKSRSHKESQHSHRSSKSVRLSPLQKVLLGKGMLATEAHRDRPKKKGPSKRDSYREMEL